MAAFYPERGLTSTSWGITPVALGPRGWPSTSTTTPDAGCPRCSLHWLLSLAADPLPRELRNEVRDGAPGDLEGAGVNAPGNGLGCHGSVSWEGQPVDATRTRSRNLPV
jgi:hypothetical protein